MSVHRTLGFLSGAFLFITGVALLFTLVGALLGLVLMGGGLGLVVLSRL